LLWGGGWGCTIVGHWAFVYPCVPAFLAWTVGALPEGPARVFEVLLSGDGKDAEGVAFFAVDGGGGNGGNFVIVVVIAVGRVGVGVGVGGIVVVVVVV
jgi:hypothetical protein